MIENILMVETILGLTSFGLLVSLLVYNRNN
jgi:hypothetical protein